MGAIRELSGQEYVHMFASDRKAELAAAAQGRAKGPGVAWTRSRAAPSPAAQAARQARRRQWRGPGGGWDPKAIRRQS